MERLHGAEEARRLLWTRGALPRFESEELPELMPVGLFALIDVMKDVLARVGDGAGRWLLVLAGQAGPGRRRRGRARAGLGQGEAPRRERDHRAYRERTRRHRLPERTTSVGFAGRGGPGA